MMGVAFWSASIPRPTPVIMSVSASTTTYVSAAASATATEAVASSALGAGDRNGFRQVGEAQGVGGGGPLVERALQQHGAQLLLRGDAVGHVEGPAADADDE